MKVVVMGPAKTGTTVIARTVQKSLPEAGFQMEPKQVQDFMEDRQDNFVSKLIFEHWSDRPYLRMAILRGELPLGFDRQVLIVRDPRDELISRMFYVAYGYVSRGVVTRKDLLPWIEIVRQKEAAPANVSVEDLLAVLNQCLGIHMTLQMPKSREYLRFLQTNLPQLDACLIRYEDFIAGQTQDLEAYLGFPLTGERHTGQYSNRVERTRAADNWKGFFLPSDLAKFREIHATDMQTVGYDDWSLAPVDQLDPAHGSQYLDRLIGEAEAIVAQS